MITICIFASGSGTNAEAIIGYFAGRHDVNIGLIISSREDAYVLQRAAKHQIPSLVLNRSDFKETENLLEVLKAHAVDFIALAGFMWLVPSYLIREFPNKIVNIHPALLPKFGGKGMYGSHIHKAVLEAGERESGITVHYVNEEYDEGTIVARESCVVNPDDTPDSLAERIHKLEHLHFPRIIDEVIRK